jgi:glutamyl-tRNA synthetase
MSSLTSSILSELIKPLSLQSSSLLVIARSHPLLFYASLPLDQTLIDHFIDFSTEIPKNIPLHMDTLESHLSLRSFLVGYTLSMADIAVWGALYPYSKQLISRPHLSRWFNTLAQMDAFKLGLSAFQKASKDAQSHSKPKDQGKMDIPLPDAQMGHVVTRFPPEPSGYLHIGHAKAALLNDYFARLYKGKLLIRFDDTNPSKEKMEFENSIKEDLKLLGIHGDAFSHTVFQSF